MTEGLLPRRMSTAQMLAPMIFADRRAICSVSASSWHAYPLAPRWMFARNSSLPAFRDMAMTFLPMTRARMSVPPVSMYSWMMYGCLKSSRASSMELAAAFESAIMTPFPWVPEGILRMTG